MVGAFCVCLGQKAYLFQNLKNAWLPDRYELFGFGEGKYHSLVTDKDKQLPFLIKDLEKAIQAIFKIEHRPPTMTRHFAEGIATDLFLAVIFKVSCNIRRQSTVLPISMLSLKNITLSVQTTIF